LLESDGLTEAAQVAEYRRLLTRLVEDRELRRAMGMDAHQMASARSWDQAMSHLLQGYAEALEPERPLIAA